MSHKIYTLGYSGSSHEDLRKYVKALDAMIVDVRFAPYSRSAMWHRQAICAAVGGSNYIHLQAFGNRNYKGPGPMELANPVAGLSQVRTILQRRPVILLCVCHDWQVCHRTMVANYVGSATGLDIEHLPARFDQWRPTAPTPPVFGETAPDRYAPKHMRTNCIVTVSESESEPEINRPNG